MTAYMSDIERPAHLPPPLWGRVGVGGRTGLSEKGIAPHSDDAARPPPLTPPHKGGGNMRLAGS
jgi:hypothetical protein